MGYRMPVIIGLSDALIFVVKLDKIICRKKITAKGDSYAYRI